MTASAAPGNFPIYFWIPLAEMGGCPGMWPLGCKAALGLAGVNDSSGTGGSHPRCDHGVLCSNHGVVDLTGGTEAGEPMSSMALVRTSARKLSGK